MIKSTTVALYSRTEGKNSQGIVTVTYTFSKTVSGNFQPKVLSPLQLESYGVDPKTANVKWFGFDNDPGITEIMRANVDGKWYEIRGLNTWPSHAEALLVPVVGE